MHNSVGIQHYIDLCTQGEMWQGNYTSTNLLLKPNLKPLLELALTVAPTRSLKLNSFQNWLLWPHVRVRQPSILKCSWSSHSGSLEHQCVLGPQEIWPSPAPDSMGVEHTPGLCISNSQGVQWPSCLQLGQSAYRPQNQFVRTRGLSCSFCLLCDPQSNPVTHYGF